MRFQVVIDNPKNAELLKSWLRHVDFVEKVEEIPFSWSLPGTPANAAEIKQILDDCMAGDEGMEADDFFASLHVSQ